MSLRETTRQILELVERASGCPVLVTEDPSLTTVVEHDDYSLRVENLPQKPPEPGQQSLFGNEGDE